MFDILYDTVFFPNKSIYRSILRPPDNSPFLAAARKPF